MANEIEAATRPAARCVAMLIYPGVTPLDVTGPLQVFDMANRLRKRNLYDMVTVAPTAESVPTSLGFDIVPRCAMSTLRFPVDTLLVSGGSGPDAMVRPDIVDWLRCNAHKSRRFGSICTGAFALGAAGLLDGKRATTHWDQGAVLARRYPKAIVDIDAIFIRDGDLYTSAGISAGIDLALALVEEDHGRDLALSVARILVLFLKRSGGQAQFSPRLRAQFSTIPAIQRVQRWCDENLAGDLRVSALSKVVRMSERTFVRKFVEETNRTPGEYVASVRLETACQFLAESELPLKAIAQRCGFSSLAAMRRTFIQRVGVSPRRYRENFRG